MAKKAKNKTKKSGKASEAGSDHKRATSTRGFRPLLLLMAFLSGASIMVVEISANRILAPWFGNSIYTWSGLIGVILVAMSCGYYMGGRLIDRNSNYLILPHLFLASAFLTLSVPFLEAFLTRYLENIDIIWGPVIATAILFATPAFLLGAVSPIATRLISLLSSDRQIGIAAGSVGMLSTMGSVIGTFLAGFVLIPMVQINIIFGITGSILALLAVAGYILFNKKSSKTLVTTASVAILAFGVTLSMFIMNTKRHESIIFDKNTFYHRIRVQKQDRYTDDSLKVIYLDSTVEGAQYEKSKEIPIEYQRYWELVKVFAPEPKSAAFLGAGSFTMPEALADSYPDAKIDVMEIDPEVVEVGRRFFRVNDYPQISPVVGDARRSLRMSERKYDLIFGDAYNGIRYIPAHLVTKEFFEIVKSSLSDNGVYMMNIITAIEGENSKLFHGIVNTVMQSFEHIHVFSVNPHDMKEAQNIILVAANRKMDMKLSARFHGKEKKRLEGLLSTYIAPSSYNIDDSLVFTDSFNPIEYIIARNLSSK